MRVVWLVTKFELSFHMAVCGLPLCFQLRAISQSWGHSTTVNQWSFDFLVRVPPHCELHFCFICDVYSLQILEPREQEHCGLRCTTTSDNNNVFESLFGPEPIFPPSNSEQLQQQLSFQGNFQVVKQDRDHAFYDETEQCLQDFLGSLPYARQPDPNAQYDPAAAAAAPVVTMGSFWVV